MKKLTIICISFLLLLNVSCRKVDEAPAQTINAFGFTTLEEAEKNLGNYAKAFYVVDGSIFTRLENFSANNSSIGIVGAWFKDIFIDKRIKINDNVLILQSNWLFFKQFDKYYNF